MHAQETNEPGAEQARLQEDIEGRGPWEEVGALSQRTSMGNGREDYSANGDAWNCFTHDQARSRAYRWGQDGLAGICDDQQLLCFALALWNGMDPILKERLFGLTNSEGNHGEDVKECYFYLDSTPTHSYMKYLYKYPQRAYPYEDIVASNKRRTRNDLEYELIHPGVFDDDRYFDIFVEYARATAEDILIRITVHNRGLEDASLHLLPTLWYRNTWSWVPASVRPEMASFGGPTRPTIHAAHPNMGDYYLVCEGAKQLLFTENETNNERICGVPDTSPYVRDGIHNYVVHQQASAVNPAQLGTKAAAHYLLSLPACGSIAVCLRLTNSQLLPSSNASGFDSKACDEIVEERKCDADTFHATVMRDPKSGVSLALNPGDITTEQDSPELVSLGTRFYQPLWVFSRDHLLQRHKQLRNLRISIGPEGSGSRALALDLLGQREMIDLTSPTLSSCRPSESAQELIQGEIDVASFLEGWESLAVRQPLPDR